MSSRRIKLLLLLCCWLALAVGPPAVAETRVVRFSNHVAPILLRHCQSCHGPEASKANYRVDTFARLLMPGESGEPAVTPGDVATSELFRRITHDDPELRMPAEADSLTDAEIATIRQWIEQGASLDSGDPQLALGEIVPAAPNPPPPDVYRRPVPVSALCFGPDGDALYVAGYHELTVWSTADGSLVRRISDLGQRIHAVDFHPDGARMVVASGTPGISGEVRVLDRTTGETLQVLARANEGMLAAAFDSAGKRLAVARADGMVSLWRTEDFQQERLLSAHSDWVNAVRWNRDGSRLATAGRDKTAKVFEVESGRRTVTYSGHTESVRDVAFSTDEQQLYSCGSDHAVHLWNLSDGKRVAEVATHEAEVLALEPLGAMLLIGTAEPSVSLRLLQDGRRLMDFRDHADWVLSLAVDPDRGRWASGSFDGTVTIRSTHTAGQPVRFVATPSPN